MYCTSSSGYSMIMIKSETPSVLNYHIIYLFFLMNFNFLSVIKYVEKKRCIGLYDHDYNVMIQMTIMVIIISS
ncbi:hypothetical protein DERF_005975 [Dermatophagoides farinae]|uniref:Uncharacterized protein n=1 Tax=Dermatophagoides farinae TaxID=6954 RepID=A0A922I4J7_DERFA|nr:hypothetical protein DERF_005975 [Dermatophagoides farinae]